MASSLKRKRVAISYREASSDDESLTSEESRSSDEQIAPLLQRRRTQPALPSRPRNSSRPQTSTRMGTLRTKQRSRLSYKEPSSDEDEEADLVESYEQTDSAALRRSKRGRRQEPQLQPQSPSEHTIRHSKPKRRAGRRPAVKEKMVIKVVRKKKKDKEPPRPIASDHVIPPWTTLPYHILLQIFVYASHPIQDNPTWLLQLARMRREFSEPALTALYRSPPFTSISKSQRTKLLGVLLNQGSTNSFNYNVKVKRLDLDSKSMLKSSTITGASLDLAALIKALPQLGEINITDPADRPPYRQPTRAARWHYPDAMFAALDEVSVHLRSFKWNARMFASAKAADHENGAQETPKSQNAILLANAPPLEWMGHVHQSKSFSALTQLALSQFAAEDKKKSRVVSVEGEEAALPPSREEQLANAIAALPELRSLIMEACTIVNDTFLPLLPSTLTALELTNCIYLTSDNLGAFLSTHGSRLRQLTLDHNQSLDLSFLPELRVACPRLEALTMDCTYYSTFATSWDAEPLYDDLIGADEVPSWPSTLQHLELVYLRNWTSEAVEVFFRSILDAAEDLQQLRVLIIKATGIRDISWRDRAQLRDKWIARLQHVFLLRSKAPDPNLVSLRAFREHKQLVAAKTGTTVQERESSVGRRLSHVEISPMAHRSTMPVESDSDAPLVTFNKRALRPRVKPTVTDDSEDIVQASDTDSEDVLERASMQGAFVQGQCHIVDVMIDNLRPREMEYREEDFLDAEISGDEDYED